MDGSREESNLPPGARSPWNGATTARSVGWCQEGWRRRTGRSACQPPPGVHQLTADPRQVLQSGSGLSVALDAQPALGRATLASPLDQAPAEGRPARSRPEALVAEDVQHRTDILITAEPFPQPASQDRLGDQRLVGAEVVRHELFGIVQAEPRQFVR